MLVLEQVLRVPGSRDPALVTVSSHANGGGGQVEVLANREPVPEPFRNVPARHGTAVRNRFAAAWTTMRRPAGGRPAVFTSGNNGPLAAPASSEIT